ncbi:MAG: hypothetical protein ACJAT4_003350 [Granulosicoccus sp.]|jgi:hypothetical protein
MIILNKGLVSALRTNRFYSTKLHKINSMLSNSIIDTKFHTKVVSFLRK